MIYADTTWEDFSRFVDRKSWSWTDLVGQPNGMTFNGKTLSIGSSITLDGVNAFVNGERMAARKDTDATWPAAVFDNFSTGTSAEVAVLWRKKNSSGVQQGANLTLGIQPTDNEAEFGIDMTDNTGASVSAPITFTYDGRVRMGLYTAKSDFLGIDVLVASTGATRKPFVIRGFASQSGNLQDWQSDSQAGLAFITSGGDLGCGGINQAGGGGVRLPNNVSVISRNAANGGDVNLISANAADQIALGTGNDIRWGKALVALGAGAAATLGTTGGSGPATTTQNTWMRVIDSGGNAFFVPAWK